jgi:hypothetical protein
MNTDEAQREGFHQAVMFHGVAMIRRLREMTIDERMHAMQEAEAITLRNPIWLSITDKKEHVVPGWNAEPITAAQVLAIIVFGMWVQVGENEELAGGLLAVWPEILQAKALGYLDP